MSAEITKPTGYGTPAIFWRLSGVDIWRKNGGGMRVVIAGYVDVAAFEAGAEPISYYTRELTQAEIPFRPERPAAGYTRLPVVRPPLWYDYGRPIFQRRSAGIRRQHERVYRIT